MNYRDLLRKYMTLVVEAEGVDFLDQASEDYFDPEEKAELEIVTAELVVEFKRQARSRSL